MYCKWNTNKAEKSRSDGHRDARGIKGPLMGEAPRFLADNMKTHSVPLKGCNIEYPLPRLYSNITNI